MIENEIDRSKELDVGYVDDNSTSSGRIKRFCNETGATEQVVIWMMKLDYEHFIMKLRPWMASANAQFKLSTDDETVISRMFNKETFEINKKSLLNTLKLYEEESKAEQSVKPDEDYVFPAREIINGNFPKTDKTKLTDSDKVNLNVDGLLDVEYDVYFDKKNNVFIPVYYNIASKNVKWYEFCVYLGKIYNVCGIEANPYLPLITFDRDLLGLDMLDENRTNEFNGKVVAECEKNIVFAVRECARFTNDSDGKKCRTEISLGDWTWLWLYAQCFNTYREAPRQTGKTFMATLTFGVEFAISYEGLLAIVVHFKSDEAKKNRNKMLVFSNNLPTYLKAHNIKTKITKGVEHKYLGPDMVGGQAPRSNNIFKNNTLKTVAVGKTESSAEQASRGDTTQLINVDEINFISQIGALMTALTFAHSTARMLAAKAGKRYGMHFTSTAGKLHTKHGKEMYKLIYTKMCKFELDLFGYSLKDLTTFLKKNSSVNFFVIKYDYDELGYTEEWLDERIDNTGTVEDILVEIFQRWLSQDQNSLFKLDIVRRLEAMTKAKVERTFIYRKNNILKFYPPSPKVPFEDVVKSLKGMCWGVDVSAGGGDYSVIYAVDLLTMNPVFVYKTNNLVVTDFTVVLIDLIRFVKTLNPTMTLVVNPEQNGPGLALIPLLIREPDIEPHIFRTIESYSNKNQVTKGWHREYNSDKYLNYGSNMSKKTHEGESLRSLMFERLLFEIVDKYPYALCTVDTISEVLTLHRKSGKVDGKIEASSGFHDDIICAALHCLTVILYENNRVMLMRFFNYTVDPSKIENMAISSHVGVFGTTSDNTIESLEKTYDYDVVEKVTVTNARYQQLIIYKYVDGIKVEITDETERKEVISKEDKIRDIDHNLKRLTFTEAIELSRHKANLSSGNNSNSILDNNSSGQNINRTLDNRGGTFRRSISDKNDRNAKMF